MENSPQAVPTPPPSGTFLQYGGQAIIEGVMMRSPNWFSVACRKPNGEIVVKREMVDKGVLSKLKWLNKPFLRGTLALLDAMVLGGRALRYASTVQMEGEQELRSNTQVIDRTAPTSNGHAPTPEVLPDITPMAVVQPVTPKAPNKINDIAIGGTIVGSLIFGFLFFRALPTAATQFLENRELVGKNAYMLNALDGVIRASLFFLYIFAISRLAGIKSVFQYHGAEHKAINTLEAGLPLTQANALAASRIHPRCGTSFIVVVIAVDFLVCLFLPRPPLLLRIPLHMAVMPLVAGIAYEIIKFAGKFRRNPLVMAAFAPGMWSQFLTTREPKPDQVDVALAALYAVLEAEGHSVPRIENAYLVPDATPEVALV